jgi:arabinofuranan 3-O-arabinosyltransferase
LTLTRPTPRERAIALAVIVLGYVIALCQWPGAAVSDTKIDLHVDPSRFLRDVASVWSSSGSLGNVQGGQYGGYLWPMGPFYAALHAAGVAPWLVHRVWLGTLLALAGYGTVRLLDELVGRPRGPAHLVAGALVVLNPYVVLLSDRTSVTLLALAALPWLLLLVHRGVHGERRWPRAAGFALVLTSTGGGVNAAVTAWMMLGPVLLLLYEPFVAGAPWRAARGFAWRAALISVPACAWWLVPLVVQTLYGINFLGFTEQPGTIWGTTSVSESLRLMGYWTSYVGVGFSGHPIPFSDNSHTMLFSAPVVMASLVVPAVALGGFAWTRRWRYGPFFLALGLVSLLVMVAGFPEGTLLRRALTVGYYHVGAVQFLRTTYKAAPLLAVALACLGGAAAAEGWRRIRSTAAPRRRVALGSSLALVVVALLATQAWPLVEGRAVDHQLTWQAIPGAWTRAGAGLDRELPTNRRAMVLPGQLFAFYRWGGTIDPILPVVTGRPVTVRSIVPYADVHATELQWTADSLVQQRRVLPGQLRPLLGLMGVGAVVTGTDDDRARSGALQPAEAVRELDRGLRVKRADRAYGPVRRFAPEPGKPGAVVALPQVRRYDLPDARGVVRVEPSSPQTIVDGSAGTLVDMAAFGVLPRVGPLFYAGDRTASELRSVVSRGGEVVVGDSNRRRVFVPGRLAQNVGWTVGAGDAFSPADARFDPFATRGGGPDSQTVAVYSGARYLRAPVNAGFSQFPEHRPFAAFDGDRRTAWLADPSVEPARRWVELGFDAPRDVPWIELTPYGDARGLTQDVGVAGRSYRVHPGVNRLAVGLRDVSSLRVAITGVRRAAGAEGAAGGIAEIRIPGVRVSESLRPPVLAERALRNRDLRRVGLSYLFERTTGDDPFRRGRVVGPAQARQVRDAQDGEGRIERRVDPPVARAYSGQAWATVSPDAPDSALDRLAGLHGPQRFDGSPRWLGRPGFRASRAFDGDPRRGWIGGYMPGTAAWLSWTTARPATVRELRLTPPPLAVASPSLVRIRGDDAASPPVRVAANGSLRLPRALLGRRFRLEVLAVRRPAGYIPRERRAVGIGEVRGRGVPRARERRRGVLEAPCGSVRVIAERAASQTRARERSSLAFRVDATVSAFDAGLPLRSRGCGTLRMGSGPRQVAVAPGLFRLDLVRLASRVPAGGLPPVGGGRVMDAGREHRASWDGVRVALRGPSWLVLGESYNAGWQAKCDGRSLGGPVVADGFANGWRAPGGCRAVSFAFGPNRWVGAGYLVSLVACLALVGLLVAAVRRRRSRRIRAGDGALASRWPLLPPEGPAQVPMRRAAVAGLAAAFVLAFAFGLRAGVVLAPAVVFVLWRGVGAQALGVTAGALLAVVVPVIYLVHGGGGEASGFATDRIAAHWVGVAAVVALLLALARAVSAARSHRALPDRARSAGTGSQTPAGARQSSPRPGATSR